MTMKRFRDLMVGCLMACPLLLQAQTVQRADTTKIPALDVDLKINVKVDAAQKGELTDDEIARAVEDGVRRALGERGIGTQPGAFTPAMKATKYDPRMRGGKASENLSANIYDRYMTKQEQKGRDRKSVV